MFFSFTVFVLSLNALVVKAIPDLVNFENAPTLTEGWLFQSLASDSSILRLSIALAQPRLEELRKRVDIISDPTHADYGAHLSAEAVRSFQEPQMASVLAVTSWLKENNVTDFQQTGAWINFNTSVMTASSLLGCSFGDYFNSETGETILRAESYKLPKSLLQHIDFVFPVTQFINKPRRRSLEPKASSLLRRQGTDMPSSCSSITPQCISDLYNITYIPPDGTSTSSLGIVGFLEQYPDLEGLHVFLDNYSPRQDLSSFTSDYDFTIETINGGEAIVNGTGPEAILDTYYSMVFTQPLDVTYFSIGGRGPSIDENGNLAANGTGGNEPWLEFLENMLSRDEIPSVLSISYTDDEQSIPRLYALRVCDLFMQLAGRGVSVLVASGDGGTAGIGDSQCYANDGSNRTQFLPTFPVGCPYVTAVGATEVYARNSAAWFSSGGFSNYFGRPAWQDATVTSYIEGLNGSHAGWYNASGRGIPDISAIGSRFVIDDTGSTPLTDTGTSASTPVIAAMIALANDKRIREGKTALGFLNPLLYSGVIDEALYDITDGTSGSCTFGNQIEEGWDATTGWDPVTGLGTLDCGKVIDLLGR